MAGKLRRRRRDRGDGSEAATLVSCQGKPTNSVGAAIEEVTVPPVRYLGVAVVAAWFGVKPSTVSTWLIRYEGWPEPDMELSPGRHGDPDKGWLPEREPEWRAWKASLPGQGAKGRPKPRRNT